MQHIVVIGGGAAGAAVVGQLLRQDNAGLDVTWLVGARAPGRGIAYATPAEHHLLNVRAGGMGLFADDVGAFAAHLRAQGQRVGDADFVPRAWYGDYVEGTLAGEIVRARREGRRVRVLSRHAVSVRGDDASGYDVRCDEGELLGADGVVLAIGALPPEPLPAVAASARASERFAADPWHLVEPDREPERVVVLGTGLTAVDVVQSAVRRWPNAQVTAISRHGRLPSPHALAPQPLYAAQTALLATLHAAPNLLTWTRVLRRAARSEQVDWRQVIDALRADTPALWQALAPVERARFLRHLRWLWESLRHRVPRATAQELARLRTQGRLKVIAGRVLAVEATGSLGARAAALDVRIRPRATVTTRHFAADLVVQATGFNLSANASAHPLVRQMIDDGVVQPDALDLGLAADADGRLIAHDLRAASGLRVLGTLLRGSVWECSGLPEIRALARRIARDMPAELHALRAARRDCAAGPSCVPVS